MTLSEREDAQLFELLSPTVGREAAMKVIDRLPPADEPLATAAQVRNLEQRMDDRFTAFEQRMDDRFAVVDQRFTAFEQRMDDRFAVVDQRFTAFEQRMDERFAVVDERFVAIDQRFDAVDQRFGGVYQRFDALEDRIDDRIDGLRTELLAAFRGELVTAVSGQTRHIIVATATAVFGIGGLAVTLAQVLG